MAVAVTAVSGPKPSFQPGAPHPLFNAHLADSLNVAAFEYDVTADGKRFLISSVTGAASVPPLTVVVNWDAASKR
jgi:hypothetical protein